MTSIRTHTSVWVSLAAILGWFLSYLPPKKRKKLGTDEHGSVRAATYYPESITPAARQNLPKRGRGLWSLALELLGAVAIRLLQRYFKNWRAALITTLKDKERLTSAGPAAKDPLIDADHPSGAELSSEKVEREMH